MGLLRKLNGPCQYFDKQTLVADRTRFRIVSIEQRDSPRKQWGVSIVTDECPPRSGMITLPIGSTARDRAISNLIASIRNNGAYRGACLRSTITRTGDRFYYLDDADDDDDDAYYESVDSF